jgi:UrcA family protein
MSHSIAARSRSSPAKLALLMLGSVVAATGVGAANAATANSDVPSIVVKYSELSLATDAGVKELYRRIESAAKQVCPQPTIRDLIFAQRVVECRDQAVARAIRQIDNSRLAALYASHSKNG